MTPTKPAGHEDVPEDVKKLAEDAVFQESTRAHILAEHVDPVRLAASAIMADRSRRAKAPAQATELAPDVKGLVDAMNMARTRLQYFADEASAGHVQAGGRELARKIWGAFAEFDALSRLSAPPAEAKPVAWRYDLENVPRDRHFLIEYDHKEVTEGYYLDNSKTSVPWQGVRPANSMRRNRVSEKIVAWCEMPLPATDKAAAPTSSDDAPPTESILHPLADREKSAVITPDPRAKAAEAVPEGMVLERTAQYFDRKARDLSGDIFATTTTRAEICRTVAAELRALAAAPQPLSTGEVNGE